MKILCKSVALGMWLQVNKLENLATGKAVDALLNYETVVQVSRDCQTPSAFGVF